MGFIFKIHVSLSNLKYMKFYKLRRMLCNSFNLQKEILQTSLVSICAFLQSITNIFYLTSLPSNI